MNNLDKLSHLNFQGKDIANGETVTGKLELILLDGDSIPTLVINKGDGVKCICYPDSIELAISVKDIAIGFHEWHKKLSNSQKCTIDPAGSGYGHGLYNVPIEQLFDDYTRDALCNK